MGDVKYKEKMFSVEDGSVIHNLGGVDCVVIARLDRKDLLLRNLSNQEYIKANNVKMFDKVDTDNKVIDSGIEWGYGTYFGTYLSGESIAALDKQYNVSVSMHSLEVKKVNYLNTYENQVIILADLIVDDSKKNIITVMADKKNTGSFGEIRNIKCEITGSEENYRCSLQLSNERNESCIVDSCFSQGELMYVAEYAKRHNPTVVPIQRHCKSR